MLTVCIMESYLALGEDTHTLRLTSELVDLRVGYAKWIRRTKFAEPHLRSSINMMQTVAAYKTKYVQYASRRDISPYGEDIHTLRLTSELVDLRVGYAKWIRRTKFAEPHLRSSVNMMHTCAS